MRRVKNPIAIAICDTDSDSDSDADVPGHWECRWDVTIGLTVAGTMRANTHGSP